MSSLADSWLDTSARIAVMLELGAPVLDARTDSASVSQEFEGETTMTLAPFAYKFLTIYIRCKQVSL